MPGWLKPLLEALGFATPFIYAAATYGFFHFLDKKASGAAKRAISRWFKPLSYDKEAVASAMVEVFDRLYTRPLLGWRAFFRSAFLSVIFSMIWAYETLLVPLVLVPLVFWPIIFGSIGTAIFTNVLADYVSLFVIRHWLVKGRLRPLRSLVTGALAGGAIIVVLYFIRDWVMRLILFITMGVVMITPFSAWLRYFESVVSYPLFVPALAVHLWLPLFALGVLTIQLINTSFRAVSWTQWFLKRGRYHPLQAIGYVAAAVVFVGTAIAQCVLWVWR